MKTYYMLTKPGIIMGNAITTAAGFALASKGHFDFGLFFATLIGLSLIIASAGVFNNYIDRSYDAKMDRTKDRALVKGQISSRNAIFFGICLGLAGVCVLSSFTNVTTVLVALTGFFVYLVLYAFLKYRTFYGTIVGSIAGAVPPVVGYCAVSNRLDGGAWIIFAILVLWQMPHFFAIAINHFDDYSAASIPVLPVARGMYTTKVHMVLYIVAFIFSCLLLSFAGYTGLAFGFVVTLLGLGWLGLCILGFRKDAVQEKKWAKQMFSYSLVVIMGICITIPFDLV